MDYKIVEHLMEKASSLGLTHFEIETEELKLKIKKENGSSSAANKPERICVPEQEEATRFKEVSVEKVEQDNGNYNIITSPIVGTFYKSQGPNSDPFVNVGSRIKKGDVVCIIEAMKLMNEIQSDFDGEIVEILVENEQMVEYGQPLFKLK